MRWMGVDGQARADHGHLLPLGSGLLDRGFHLGGWGAPWKNDGGEGQDVTYDGAGLQLRPGGGGKKRNGTVILELWHPVYSRK